MHTVHCTAMRQRWWQAHSVCFYLIVILLGNGWHTVPQTTNGFSGKLNLKLCINFKWIPSSDCDFFVWHQPWKRETALCSTVEPNLMRNRPVGGDLKLSPPPAAAHQTHTRENTKWKWNGKQNSNYLEIIYNRIKSSLCFLTAIKFIHNQNLLCMHQDLRPCM